MQTRTRDQITSEILGNIVTSIQAVHDSYKRNHSGLFAKKPLAKPLEDLVACLGKINAKVGSRNDTEEYKRFKKFVGMTKALLQFTSSQVEHAKDHDYIQVKRFLITELSSQDEVKKFIFEEHTHDYSQDVLSAIRDLDMISRYLHLSRDIESQLNQVVARLDLLSDYPTTGDALFSLHWNVSQGCAAYPLWNKLCNNVENIFASEETMGYLPRILVDFDSMTGLHIRSANYLTESSSNSQKRFTQEDVDAFKNELEIFTAANFVKLLTDCMRSHPKKITSLQIESKRLVESVLTPFLEKLATANEHYNKTDVLEAIIAANENFKMLTTLSEMDKSYVEVFKTNYMHIFNCTGNLSRHYDTMGHMVTKHNFDEQRTPSKPTLQRTQSERLSSHSIFVNPAPQAAPDAQNLGTSSALTPNASRH